MIKVGIAGATGYVGIELIHIQGEGGIHSATQDFLEKEIMEPLLALILLPQPPL